MSTEDSPLSSKVAMFNNQVQQHKQSQLLNPFSSSNGRVSPKPAISKDQAGYGKPLAGSLTEARGQKANMHVMKEMLELCQIIDSEGYKVNDEPNMRVIPFGELFNIYNYISDKVVGILLRARKHKLLDFEGEMLFQRRDDDVPIFLLKPIQEIRRELESKINEIKRGSSPAPMATTLLMNKGAVEQKLQESALNAPQGSLRSRTPSPAKSKASTPAVSKATTPATSKATSPAPEAKPAPTAQEPKPIKVDIETPKVVVDAPPAEVEVTAPATPAAVEPQKTEENAAHPIVEQVAEKSTEASVAAEKPAEEVEVAANIAAPEQAPEVVPPASSNSEPPQSDIAVAVVEIASASAPAPTPVEASPAAPVDDSANKTDVNNNNATITSEFLPTPVIAASAIHVHGATTEAEADADADAEHATA